MNAAKPAFPVFDASGFLMDSKAWNEDLARDIAEHDDIGLLSPAHWKIIRHLRHSWLDSHNIPAVYHTCHLVGMGPLCLEELFHGHREAWRVAGLPDPGEEARSYM